ncbi:MAG: glycosyltransferase [Sphingomonadaceae bacterium]|nr:glycosyltransferase [Sphingomonadaceae bacterium]
MLVDSSKPNARVAVDLLAILPGGANGGAKLLALDLVKELSKNWIITCFCLPEAAHEISWALGEKVQIVCVARHADLESAYAAEVAKKGPFAVNFFPMQHVSLQAQGTPTISVVHDLQFLDMPDNFTSAQTEERAAAFRTCIERSDLIVTVSNFSMSRISQVAGVDSDRIKVIYNALNNQIAEPSLSAASIPDGYFLYPANFWPHKNHARLLEAYRIYRKIQVSPLDLMLTGDPGVASCSLVEAAKAEPGVFVTGYLSRCEFQSLLSTANALIFPSLYEGFGMPIVEAMSAGIPVACSNAGSLPEIAGSAALHFDGSDASAIAEAMVKVSTDRQLRSALIAAGRKRQLELGDFSSMCHAYSDAMNAVCAKPEGSSICIHGVDGDGWADSTVTLELSGTTKADQAQLHLVLPDWAPLSRQTLMISSGSREVARATLWPGKDTKIDLRLLPGERTITLNAGSCFRLCDLLDTQSERSASYRFLAATSWVKGRRSNLWPARTVSNEITPSDVALAAIVELPNNGFSISIVGVSTRPVAIRPIASIADTCITLAFRSEPLVAGQSHTPVTQIALPPEKCIPALDCAAGIVPITLNSPKIVEPAAIVDVQTEEGFSVIIPSFNQGRFLDRTIDSILSQDHVLEVLVLDGGSTDTTLDVLASYGNRISWWSESDEGQADAVNKGLARARGEYIAWINSDDTYAPGAFAHVARILASDQTAAVVYGDADHIDENDRFIEPYPTMDFSAAALMNKCFICQPAAFFRRRVAVEHGGLRPSLRFCLDYEFWLRLAKAEQKFKRTRKLLAHSRMYPENKTLGQRLHAYFETADMMIRGAGYNQGQWPEHFANAAADHLRDRYGIPRAYALREALRLANTVWPRTPS